MTIKLWRLLLIILVASVAKNGYACSLAAWNGSTGLASSIHEAKYEGSCGLRVDLSGTSPAFVEDATAAGLSQSVVDYAARFYLYIGDMTLGGSDRVDVFTAYSSGSTELFGVEIVPGGTGLQARLYVWDDNGILVQQPGAGPMLETGWRAIEVQWNSASGPGAKDGQLSLSIDGGAGLQTLVGLDTDTQAVGIVGLGILAGNSASVTGSIDFDSFVAQRTGSPGLVSKTCSGGVVDLQDITFLSGSTDCTATGNIVLGRRVVFDAGSEVMVTAPDIRLEPGVRIRQGATVSFRH